VGTLVVEGRVLMTVQGTMDEIVWQKCQDGEVLKDRLCTWSWRTGYYVQLQMWCFDLECFNCLWIGWQNM